MRESARRHPRRVQVRFWPAGEPESSYVGYSHNLSATGMFVATVHPTKPGRVLVLEFKGEYAGGFWNPENYAYRLPVFVPFLVVTAALTIWPRKKNLEHLFSHSTAIVIGTQFWYPQQGGVYLLWYLPLLLLVQS